MENKSCLCIPMKRLQYEQGIIARSDIEFQFIRNNKKSDTIPFMLYSNERNRHFMVHYQGVRTTYFRLEKLDEDSCHGELSVLLAIDIDGNPVDSSNDYYTLQKTKTSFIVNLNRYDEINPFPIDLVNRPLPIIEPKW